MSRVVARDGRCGSNGDICSIGSRDRHVIRAVVIAFAPMAIAMPIVVVIAHDIQSSVDSVCAPCDCQSG